MYHYLRGSREYPCREVPSRDPQEIRDEIGRIRRLLETTEALVKETEERREHLLLAMEEGKSEERDGIAALLETVRECEGAKDRLEALWDYAEVLAEELRDTLYFLRGGVA